MSQDKSDPINAQNAAAEKGETNPATDLAKESGKRKESGIAQPVDALRQSIGQTTAQPAGQSRGMATEPNASPDGDKRDGQHPTAAVVGSSASTDNRTRDRLDGRPSEKADSKQDNQADNALDKAPGKASGKQAKATSQAEPNNQSSKQSNKRLDTAPNKLPNTSPNTSQNKSPHISPNTSPNTTAGSTSAMDSNKQASPSKPSGSRGVWGGIFLGLVLVVVALAAGLWWQQQRFETVAREVATRLQQSDQLVTQARDNAGQALELATAQRDAIDQLSRELAVTANELETLQQAWEAANEGLDQTLLLNDLERLINMANQELVLFGNVSSAVSILSSVDAMLKNQSAPALKALQQAVITDLARLRAVPQVDVTSLSARLDSLIQLTGKAPLLSPSGQVGQSDQMVKQNIGQGKSSSQGSAAGAASVTNATNTTIATDATESKPSSEPAAGTAAGSEQPWWQAWASWDSATSKVSQWTSEASSTLMREFADVMSIRKADDPQALLLSEEQAIQLRANVRAMLLSAQLALMTRQADIWRSELSEVQSLLNTRYDTQALDTKASLNLLNELLDAPVAAEVPQLTETLSALALAERALNIPTEQDNLPSQSDASESDGNAQQAQEQGAAKQQSVTGGASGTEAQETQATASQATASQATRAPTTTSQPTASQSTAPQRSTSGNAASQTTGQGN